MRNLKLISQIIFALLFSQVSFSASPSSFTYEGILTDSSGTPVDLNGQTITFSIIDGSNCIIYEETSNAAGDSSGLISHAVGTGTVTFGSFGPSLFNSSQTGSSSCVVPASATRYLKVSIASPSITATVNLTSVPYALESSAIGGYAASSLLRTDGSVASVSPLNNTDYTKLLDLIAGSSSLYVSQSSPTFTSQPQYSGAPISGSDLANKSYVDAQVSSALPNILTPGTFTKVITDSKGRITSGSTLTESDLPTLTTAGKVNGGAITSGTIGGATALNTSGNLTTTGSVSSSSLSSTSVSTNNLFVYDSSNTKYIKFTANPATSLTFLLPTSYGTSGQFLSTDGTGNLSWANAAAGSTDASYATKGLVQANTDAATSGLNLSSGIISVNSGTGANQIVKLDASSKLPAVDGSNLTNLSATQFSSGILPVSKGGTGSASALTNNKVMVSSAGTIVEGSGYGSTKTANSFILRDASGGFAAGTGTFDSLKVNGSVSGTLTFTAPSSFTSYSLNWPTADGTAGQFLKTDGAGNLAWASATSLGITSLNGSTVSTQTFATPGTSGTAPGWSTNVGTGVHTLNIPMASTASVTAGLISKTDYDSFNTKLGTSTSFSGDVSGPYSATSVDKIKGTAVSISSLTSGNFLRYNGSAWVNSGLSSGDITTALTYSPVNRAGDTMSGALNLGGNNVLNVNQLSFKDSGSNVVALKAPATVGTSYSLVLPTADGSAGQFLKTDGAGNLAWGTSAAPGDATYSAKGIVQFNTDAATSGITVASGVASVNAGTGANQIVKLDASSKLPAVDGSALTGLNANNVASGILPMARGGTGASTKNAAFNALSPLTTKGDVIVFDGTNNIRLPAGSNGQVLTADSAQASGVKWAAVSSGSVTSVTGGTGLTGGTITSSGTLSVNVGTGASQIVQLDATAKLPAVDGSALTNLNASNISSGTLSISRGGTGSSAFAANNIVGTNGTGTALQAVTCAQNQVLSFDASGNYGCYNLSSIAGGTYFANGGNSFGATATLGTSDSFGLRLVTGALVRMTIAPTGNVGIGTTTPAAPLDVKGEIRLTGATSGYAGFKSPAVGPSVTWVLPSYDGSSGQFLQTDGAGNLTWGSAAASGLVSLNGLTGSSQTFAVGTSGTSPNFSSTSSTHTLNIPMANSAGVIAGLLSKADYDTFNSKLGTSTSLSGDVSGSYNAISVDKIKGSPLAFSSLSSGNFLKYNGTTWANANLSTSDLASGILSIARGGTGSGSFTSDSLIVSNSFGSSLTSLTCASGQTLSFVGGTGTPACESVNGASQLVRLAADGKLPVLDGSQLSNLNAASVTTGVLPIARGGTNNGALSVAAGGIVYADGTKLTTTAPGASNQILSYNISGPVWYTPNQAGLIMMDGNSGVGNLSIGTKDSNQLNFRTSNTVRMTIDSAGSVNIPDMPPSPATYASLYVKASGNNIPLILYNDTADKIAAIDFFGYTGVAPENKFSLGFVNPPGSYPAYNYGYIGTNAAADLSIRTDNTDRIHIQSPTGYVGVNTYSPSTRFQVEDTLASSPVAYFYNKNTGSTAGGVKIQLGATSPGSSNDFVSFYQGGGSLIGHITGNGGTSVQYLTTSDRRLKENIRDTHFTIQDLLKVQVRDYNYKKSDLPATGFIAQELYDIYPFAVNRPEDESKGTWGVDYGLVTPLLVKGVQDLYGMCKSNETQSASNTMEIQILKKSLGVMEQRVTELNQQLVEIKSKNTEFEKNNAEKDKKISDLESRLERLERLASAPSK